MRVVVDTNVFVSSFFGGKPRRVIDLWRDGAITLCISPPIIDEYVAVLTRMGLGQGGELEELLRWFARGRNTLFASQLPPLRVVAGDPDDDKFLACAVALEAPVIVSGDRHLLEIGTYLNIRILKPAEFLAVV